MKTDQRMSEFATLLTDDTIVTTDLKREGSLFLKSVIDLINTISQTDSYSIDIVADDIDGETLTFLMRLTVVSSPFVVNLSIRRSSDKNITLYLNRTYEEDNEGYPSYLENKVVLLEFGSISNPLLISNAIITLLDLDVR
jgi:hypothetical protein